MNVRLLCFLFVALTTLSCTKDSAEPEIILEQEEYTNLAYGDHERHKLDVFLPEGRNQRTPVVVLIHGGAWTDGDKSDMEIFKSQVFRDKYAVININYRFAGPGVSFDRMLDDIAQAVGLVKRKSQEWGIRNSGYTVLGVSSGAHLGMLYAYGVQRPGEVSSVISLAGPTDLTTLTTDPLLNLLLTTVLVGVPADEMFTHPRFQQASPLYQVSQAVPTLMIHGTADGVVPYAQSESLRDALSQASVTNKLITMDDAGHDIYSLSPLDIFSVYTEVSSWIRTHGQ